MSIINTSLIGKVKKQLKGVINGDIDIAYNPTGDFDITEIEETTVAEALNQLGQESNWWSNINSAVRLYGGIIQDNGDGTVRVSSGGGLYKKNASSVEGVPAGECEPMGLNTAQGGRLYYHTWEENLNVELTNNAYNYIYIVWDHTIDNGLGDYGNTAVIASTNFYLTDWENDDTYYDFREAHPELNLPARRSGMLHAHTVGRVYKMDNEITIRVCGTNGWNFNKRVQLFGEEFFPVVRARGLAIEAAQGDLQFNITEGVMWAEMANRFTVRGFSMDDGDTFTSWYQHTAINFEGDLASIQTTYPTGITDNPYAILYSTTDDKYYRYESDWTEVLDYIQSKVNINSVANLSAIESAYSDGFFNITSDGNDYVILQLQATDEYYQFNDSLDEGEKWEIFTGDVKTKVSVAYIGNLEGMNADHPNGYQGNIDIIVPTDDGNYYEYSGVDGEGWVRVNGYVWRSGWLRFYNQNKLDVNRYNDVINNKLVDIEDNQYGVAWVYMVHDNSCHVVYGRESYTQEGAAQASLPTPLPGLLAAYSTLVGKITYSKGVTEFTNAKLESPFTEKFVSSGVSLHNDFAGLQGGNASTNEYYHLDEEQYIAIDNFLNSGTENYISTSGDDVKYGDLDITNGALSFTQSSGSTDVTSVYVPMPDGGIYSSNDEINTGYLKITLPQSWTNTMMSFDINIYDRTSTTGELIKIHVAGLTTSTGEFTGEWTHTVARIVSGITDKFTDIKFGHDGTKCALYIGSNDTEWEYPQVTITNFQAGFAAATSATWVDDWEINFTTTLGTISSTKTVISSHDHNNLSNLNSINQDLGTTDDVTFAALTADSVQFTGGTGTQGTLSWNNSDKTLDLVQDGTTLQLGQETHFMIRNATGSTIDNGTFLGFTGVTVGSNRIEASPFNASTMEEHQLVGFATETINNGINGLATTFGYVRGLDTRGTAPSGMAVGDEDWSVGDTLYPHPTVPGKLTTVEPTTGFRAKVAVITNRHQSAGEIFVRVIPHNERFDEYASTAYGWGNHADAGYLQTESDTLDDVCDRGNVTDQTITVGGVIIDNNSKIDTNNITLTTTGVTSIATFAHASFGSAKVLIQTYDSITGERQITELLIVHDGTTASAHEYGLMYTGSSALATFDVDISGTDVRILATDASTNSTQHKVVMTQVVA